ncbi:MAG: hypothetical protein JWM68_3857 [Verrucomicrobiales bacterium]|nr:hypothetical protein [Verrucomicrobiales bacterium]
MYRLSRYILLAHEDKTFQGAVMASINTSQPKRNQR